MATYPKPGRGAWTLTGGLLPVKPGSKSKSGYYRRAVEDELPVGYAWLSKSDTSHHAQCVWMGVKSIQALLGITEDGWFGPATQAASVGAQQAAGIVADGIVGRSTMRVLLTPIVHDLSVHISVPESILGGIAANESALDPAAVGVNGEDHGVVQINLAAHPEVSLETSMNPADSLHFAAEDLHQTFKIWEGRTKNDVDPWDVAIANHNSPLLAKKWALSGEAPVVKNRPFQIADYVKRVREAW